ncbi:hypothetical protein [Caballeronia ptereochthonis]|uniref:hypothetical protein n=1 Tax=Caballeronia ptereochthonis TaxID=1777144 RepID=UPI00117E06ED|nr:hypothetical protein [Caballeronia ptereochthonis]
MTWKQLHFIELGFLLNGINEAANITGDCFNEDVESTGPDVDHFVHASVLMGAISNQSAIPCLSRGRPLL